MQINEQTYKVMPSHLQKLFVKLPNPCSEEVLELFPQSAGQQGDVKGTEPSRTGGEGTSCYGEYGRVATPKRSDSGSAARFFYCAKASKSERNRGCEGLERQMPTWNQGSFQNHGIESGTGRIIPRLPRQNNHPTVKPLALMKYLVKLISSPKDAVIIDPFMGSGTTLIACKELGIKCIGIDTDEYACEIAVKRCQAIRQEVMELKL